MTEFKVGDKVWCITHDEYNITDYHVMCEVTKIVDDMIKVKTAIHQKEFLVRPEYFELISFKKRILSDIE